MANTQKNNTNTNTNFSDVQAVIRADVGEEAAIALGLGDADDIVLQGLRSLASQMLMLQETLGGGNREAIDAKAVVSELRARMIVLLDVVRRARGEFQVSSTGAVL